MKIFNSAKEKYTGKTRIALVPDRFAHYRQPIFQRLSEETQNSWMLHIYADSRQKGSVKLVSSEYCNLDYLKGGVYWFPVKDYIFKNVCIWQSKIVSVGLKGEYDMIVFWGDAWRMSTWISAVFARISGKKVVFWTHGLYGKESALKLSVRLGFYKIAHGLLLYGQHSKTLLVQKGFDSNKIWVINNSLDYDAQCANYLAALSGSKDPIFSDDGSIVLVFIGRLEKNKSLDMLIRSIADLNSVGFKFRLVLVGQGACSEELIRLATELGVLRFIVFYGACYDQKELALVMIKSDICVSPGNVGLTAMQSLAYGVPVVTHNDARWQMPEYEAVVEGCSGALYEYGSQASLNAAIIRCLDYIKSGKINVLSCQSVIEKGYTPVFQAKIFKNMVDYFFSRIDRFKKS